MENQTNNDDTKKRLSSNLQAHNLVLKAGANGRVSRNRKRTKERGQTQRNDTSGSTQRNHRNESIIENNQTTKRKKSQEAKKTNKSELTFRGGKLKECLGLTQNKK